MWGESRPVRFGGSILVVGDGGAELTRMAQALDSLAETLVVGPRDASAALSRLDVDVIVAEEGGSEKGGRQLLEEAAALRPGVVRILLGGTDSEAESLNGTAEAALPKPVDLNALRALCSIALRCTGAMHTARELENENHRLRGIDTEPTSLGLDELQDIERYEGILTRSPGMKRVLGLLQKIEGSETTVLIQGETGTGKELVAQAIHARSSRRNRRFVAVNLGAVSDHLRESELFGHVRGAFTGAVETRGGLFVEADGGCIFLDEVGDASPGLQVALLRVLEEGTIMPVGSDRPRKVDVRVISGTNRNLEELVRQGLFRRDLYYRLNVFPVDLPPLRERREDIFPLAQHFLVLASHAMGKKPPGISREARAVLEAYHWEGNVRELRNVMERAAILCKGGLVIAADLPMSLDRKGASNGHGPCAATIAIPPGGASLVQLERDIFLKTLELAGGNQSRAASILGLCESTFRFRLRKLGIASRRATVTAQAVANAQRIAS
jgi:DNA-binding NtrC family response regulator